MLFLENIACKGDHDKADRKASDDIYDKGSKGKTAQMQFLFEAGSAQ